VSTGAHPELHRVHWLQRWVVRLLVALVAAAGIVLGIVVGVDRAFLSGQTQYSWPPEPCVVQGIDARCGSFVVPESRTKPNGRTIGLNVVVLPASLKPARSDAAAYLAGGPGDAATELAATRSQQLTVLNMHRDILLVDQRGTGRSKPHHVDATQYGTRMAMDDLDAVRAALGYRQLDLIGSSYGATAAQVYAKLHPSSMRTLVLVAGTAIDLPFFDRHAVNAQRALDQLAEACASQPDCRAAFPGWERQFGELVKAWNADPVHGRTGDEFASVVHAMLLDMEKAVSIPLVVSRAENHQCDSAPKRREPRPLWTLPTASAVPLIAFVGGADPQDPFTNLSGLKEHFPDSRTVAFPRIGHDFNIGGCVDEIMADFADRGTTRGVDATRCAGAVVVPPFVLSN
jgi:pimeloyl-ACP methyl ester carboxylesterase